jgi:hypothetical protein
MEAVLEEQTAPPAYRWRWVGLFVILTVEVMDLLDALVTTIAGPVIRHELDGSLSLIQWLGAAYTLAMAIGLVTAVGAVLLLYPLVQGRELDWPVWVFVMLAAGVIVFGLFGRYKPAGTEPAGTRWSRPACSASGRSPAAWSSAWCSSAR